MDESINIRLSSALRILPERLGTQQPTLHDILHALDECAVALILLAFSVPAIVPTPAIPAGVVFGSALALIGLQMIAGMKRIRLPPGLSRIRIGQALLRSVIQRCVPHLERMERRLRPRLRLFVTPAATRAIGAVVFVMAVLIALPIPFGNTLPGLSVLILGLGLGQQDGAIVLAGLGLAVVAAAVSAMLVGGSWWLIATYW